MVGGRRFALGGRRATRRPEQDCSRQYQKNAVATGSPGRLPEKELLNRLRHAYFWRNL